jgi:hypothetical protein
MRSDISYLNLIAHICGFRTAENESRRKKAFLFAYKKELLET